MDVPANRAWQALPFRLSGMSGGLAYDAGVSMDQSLFPDDDLSVAPGGATPLGQIHADSASSDQNFDSVQGEVTGRVGGGEVVPGWQLDMLRRALDTQGLVDMNDRKLAVERAVGRSVDSLRDLSAVEVRAVLAHFAAMPGSDSGSRSQNSSWDERDHDTWIDRL